MSEASVRLPPLVGGQAESWLALVELAESLGEHWLLVGGQMVFLHEVERRASQVRPTDDVDVVVDVRAEPAGLTRIHAVLVDAGFSQDAPSPDGVAHRYRRGQATFDVLAPDNLGSRAQLDLGVGRTIQAPGATQALRRSAVVRVHVGDQSAMIRRPNLDGALIGKAAVVKIASQSPASRSKRLRDFDSLAQMLGPSDRAEASFTKSESRLITQLNESSDLSELGAASVKALLDARWQ